MNIWFKITDKKERVDKKKEEFSCLRTRGRETKSSECINLKKKRIGSQYWQIWFYLILMLLMFIVSSHLKNGVNSLFKRDA